MILLNYYKKKCVMITKASIFLIKFYQQTLSPFKGACCIYSPSCSEYAVRSIDQFGMLRGAIYAFRRLRRCNVRDQPVVMNDPIPELSGKASHLSA